MSETSLIIFQALNGDCSALDSPRELKLMLIEQSDNEDSEYVLKVCQKYM